MQSYVNNIVQKLKITYNFFIWKQYRSQTKTQEENH